MIKKIFHIEEDFECEGYRCIVLVNFMCLRNGYVGVSKKHPAYKKSYSELVDDIDVHGGLTFSGTRSEFGGQPNDLWWFGFDCGHFGDKYAVDEAIKYGLFVENNTHIDFCKKINEWSFIDCTQEYVKSECIKLAKQLKEMENKANETE